MAGVQRSGARWVALLLGVALVASGVVAYALIRVTAPGPGGNEAISSAPTTLSGSMLVSPVDETVSPATPTEESTPPASSESTAMTATRPATTSPQTSRSSSESSSSLAATPTTPPMTPPAEASTTASPSSSSTAVSTVTSRLAGSGVTLPAAWSGEAKITVAVLGKCATGSNSVYTNTPADLALDLPQNEASAVAPTVTARLPDDEPTLTLGVNAQALPSLALGSSTVDAAGRFHRYWSLRLTPAAHRTTIHGVMLPQSGKSATDNPNFMVDTETSLQPCKTAGTADLPRVLAAGSTLTGWVSQTSAKLTLHATTTDGERKVTVQVTATRKP